MCLGTEEGGVRRDFGAQSVTNPRVPKLSRSHVVIIRSIFYKFDEKKFHRFLYNDR